MIRVTVFALACAASLLAQGPVREKYHPVKVEKIYSFPQVPLYVYLLSGGKQCEIKTRLYVTEGSEVKAASEEDDVYVMDSDGLVYRCGLKAEADHAVPRQQPNKK